MRLRRYRWTVVTGVVCTVALTTLVVALYGPRPTPPLPAAPAHSPTSFVVVEGVDLLVSYNGTSEDNFSYFDSPECVACPSSLVPGSTWSFAFSLTNRDSIGHVFQGVTVATPFALQQRSPGGPVALGPGNSTEVDLVVQLPVTPGYYFLTGTLWAN
jgi:hypothetical protein